MIKYNLQNAVSCVNCYNYSMWNLLAWWLYIHLGCLIGVIQHRLYIQPPS